MAAKGEDLKAAMQGLPAFEQGDDAVVGAFRRISWSH